MIKKKKERTGKNNLFIPKTQRHLSGGKPSSSSQRLKKPNHCFVLVFTAFIPTRYYFSGAVTTQTAKSKAKNTGISYSRTVNYYFHSYMRSDCDEKLSETAELREFRAKMDGRSSSQISDYCLSVCMNCR